MNAGEHITDAICLIDKVKAYVKGGDTLMKQEVADLLTLMDQVRELRDKMIQRDLECGLPYQHAAAKYNLSTTSILQIKLRGQS